MSKNEKVFYGDMQNFQDETLISQEAKDLVNHMFHLEINYMTYKTSWLQE